MTPTPNNRRSSAGGREQYRKKEISLGEAIRRELRDRFRNFRLGFSIETEDIIRIVICAVLILLNVHLQTTFFARFAPFGAIPDVMLILSVAIGASEGEKFGAVTGLVGAYLLRCTGGISGIDLNPVLYAFSGYFAGLLTDNYFSNTVAVRAVYAGAACILRAIFSTVTAKLILSASFVQILTDVAIPEFFSTAVISPLVFGVVWLSFHKFHKSRAERTGS